MTSEEWKTIRFFNPQEFDSPDQKGSGANMDLSFVRALDRLRAEWGPLKINSGYRTIRHNALVGGKPNSSHLRGLAADIHMDGLSQCIRFAILAAQNGFRRIGINWKGTYVHVDLDTSLPSPSLWWYGSPPAGIS